MRGSIRKYGPSWAYRLELGRDHATGKRLQLQRGGFKTRRVAEAALAEVNRGGYVRAVKGTLAEYLEARWLPAKPTSLRAHRR